MGTQPMNRLEALKAALEAKRSGNPHGSGWLDDLLTDDTIAALIAVAEAADAGTFCPFCGALRNGGQVRNPHLDDCPLAPLVEEVGDDRA